MDKEFSIKRYLLAVLLIFIAWLPVLAAYYPGVFAYDVTRQLENKYTVFHPLIHTWLLGVCFKAGGFCGNNYTLGILAYSLLQMAVMALCFAYGVMYISKNGRLSKLLREQ